MAATPTITRMVSLIRKLADEAVIDAKYSLTDLLEFIEANFQVMLTDINAVAANPLMVRHNILLGSTSYMLPPSVDQIVRIAKLDGNRQLEYQFWGAPSTSWTGPGISLEGRLLRFEPTWLGGADTVEILYIPNGDFRLHYGTALGATKSTVVLAETPTLGTLDTRENAYVGAVLRLLDDGFGYEQERTITAYDRMTRTATVSPDFSPIPIMTPLYEVVPIYGRLVEMVVALHVAEELAAVAANTTKAALLERQHAKAKRALIAQLGRMQNILGGRMTHLTMFGGR